MPLILGANSLAGGGYEIDNSLRFNSGSSDNLSKVFASAPTSDKIGTLSFWFKTLAVNQQYLVATSTATAFYLYFDSSSRIVWQNSVTNTRITSQVFRDPSAWYHLVVSFDTTQATASNRQKMYLNGSEITNFSSSGDLSLNQVIPFFNNDGSTKHIGSYTGGGFYSGYEAEFHAIDGQQLDPTSFGEFDEDSGIWKPIAYTGTYGTNGFYLEFKDSSALGDDTSGNTNDFTVNNLTSIDQTTDTPSNNFATLNPLLKGANYPSFAQGNLQITSTGSIGCAFSTMAMTKGKWYWEIYLVANAYRNVGICDVTQANGLNYPGTSSLSWGYNVGNGRLENNSLNPTWSTGTSAGNTVNVALDMDNGKLFFGVNGTYLQSGNPVTGANPAVSNLLTLGSGEGFYFCDSVTDAPTQINQENFGNPPFTISSGNSDANNFGNFEYEVPSGYYALCTKNLAEYG